jgi:hypothetical protein
LASLALLFLLSSLVSTVAYFFAFPPSTKEILVCPLEIVEVHGILYSSQSFPDHPLLGSIRQRILIGLLNERN